MLDILKSVKLNFGKCIIDYRDSHFLDHDFDISPKDFLNYSKQDFKLDNERGNINALTNAKRAIDCQTDKILYCFGIDPNKLPKASINFVSFYNDSIDKQVIDVIPKLKILKHLNFTPTFLISKARALRNKLEHFYRVPSKNEVIEAIELAELFILATDNKLNNVWDFGLTDENNCDTKSRICLVNYDFQENSKTYDLSSPTLKVSKQITCDDPEFYFIIKIATSFVYPEDTQEALIEFLTYIKHPIPRESIEFNFM